MEDSPEKTITLGKALLSNLVLPFAAAYLYYTGTSLRIVLTSCAVTFVVLNSYFLVAFKVWGQKSS
jgi:hypothetical protein